MTALNSRTIHDFAERSLNYPKNTGRFESLDYLQDVFGELYDVSKLQGQRIAEIGSRSGQVVNMLLDAGASKVIAIEPAACFSLLCQNVRHRSNKVVAVHAEGEAIREYTDLDLVCSIGALHYVEKPDLIVKASLTALKPGGKMIIWLYAVEGNGWHLAVNKPLRSVISRLPDRALSILTVAVLPCLVTYMNLCRLLPLPGKEYMRNYLAKLNRLQLRNALYNELDSLCAKRYTRSEALALLANNGFTNVRCFHRHKYSWTVIGERPASTKSSTW